MATQTPPGWRQRTTNSNEYEAILNLGNFEKYEINVNVQTGQRQIYAIDAVFRTREFVGTINADGSVIRQDAWNNIANLQNGQTRLKRIVDASRTAANKIVSSVGSEEQKRRLAEQKEFSSLKSEQQSPPQRNPGSTDTGADPSNTGQSSGTPGGNPSSVEFQNELDKYGSNQEYGNIVYPSNSNETQDRIVITQFKYVTAEVFSGGFNSTDVSGLLSGTDLSARTFTKTFGSVALPMPNNISETNETGWGSNELSTLSAAALGAGVKLVDQVTDGNITGAIQNLTSTISGMGGGGASDTITKLLTLRAGAAVVSKFGLNVDPSAFLSRSTGTVVNPNLELLFQGPKLRTFNYQIKMSPRNQTDAQRIRKIIKFFKKGMAAQRPNNASTGFFLGAPNVFQIKFYSGNQELRSLGQIKMCALTNFNVDYTPDGTYAAFYDSNAGGSQPVSTNISLTFTELTPVYEDNYAADDHTGFGDGYNPANIESQDLTASEGNTQPNNQRQPRGQNPNQPAAGTAAGSPVPPLVTGVDNITGSNNRPPSAGTPGSLALPTN